MAAGRPRSGAVVFDVGGVIVDWNPRHLYRQILPDEDAVEEFLAVVCTPEWHAHHDAGRPMAETIPDLCEAHPHLADEITLWRTRYVDMVAGTIEGMVELIEELRAERVPLYLLSNMPAEVYDDLRSGYPVFDSFDGAVISGQERIVKPDARIFHLTVERFGLDPAATVFVDDIEANVAAAATTGFNAVQFTSAAQLRIELVSAALLRSL